ncbi:hypothetical protein V6N13_034456 [Hibiscus sabdariffa]|uniref:Uncharacterized protein n=2 Tax=Hibiscus sabdariffa TaxID=183260 RepID=A0ABR1ZRS9_9ROSI
MQNVAHRRPPTGHVIRMRPGTVQEHIPATSNEYRQDVAHRRPPTGLVIWVRPGTFREHNPATGNAAEHVACHKPPSGCAVRVKKGAIRGHSLAKTSSNKWVNASVCIGACRRLRGAGLLVRGEVHKKQPGWALATMPSRPLMRSGAAFDSKNDCPRAIQGTFAKAGTTPNPCSANKGDNLHRGPK